jgi:hypothetical protein
VKSKLGIFPKSPNIGVLFSSAICVAPVVRVAVLFDKPSLAAIRRGPRPFSETAR